MNRRAKRNKYKKIVRNLENRISFYERKMVVDHCFSKDVKVQQIQCFKPVEEYSKIPTEIIKEQYQKEVAKQIAEEILKHQDYFKVQDTGYGYIYGLSIVKIE